AHCAWRIRPGHRSAAGRHRGATQPARRRGQPGAGGPDRVVGSRRPLQSTGWRLGGSRGASGIRAGGGYGEGFMTSPVQQVPPAVEPAVLTYSPALSRPVKAIALVVVTLVTCMEFLTSYAMGVALPDMQGDLSASPDQGSWILTTYSTCFLIGLL